MRFKDFWDRLTLKNKIGVYTGLVFFIIMLAFLLDAFILKLFVSDFNDIMADNLVGGQLVAAIADETKSFDEYIKGSDPDESAAYDACVEATLHSIKKIPLNYAYLGENRYAQMEALTNAYATYCSARNQVVTDYRSEKLLVDKLYDVYDMQKYLSLYAQKYVDITMNEGNSRYNNYLPLISFIPYLMIGLSVLLFIMAFQVSRMMDKTITEPVLKLADASRRIANNDFFTDDIRVDNKDELGELVMAFNKMKYATGEYILALEERRIALDQLHAREVENLETAKQLETMNLELLKSQINPHFLFNTLNVIGGMANLEDAPTTEQMIGALSSLFRYNLKTQEKETLLSQELKIAGDYMYLQKMRFGDRVSFDLKCGVDADNVMVPTFTFQPLLENCIIHGISPKVEGGRVDVSINRSGDELIITVEDTGIGIEKDVLEKIRQQLEEKADRTVLDKDVVGIGLGNINRRIRSMYQDSAFELDSEKDKGTKITIRIPYNKVIRQDPEE